MKEKDGEHPFGDTGQLICFGLFLLVWVGDSFFMRTSNFLPDILPLFIRLVLAGIAGVGAIYFVKSGHVATGSDARPAAVISSGGFRYVRHPLYLGSVLFYLALAVSTASLLSLLVFLAVFGFYEYITGYEEKLMTFKFGKEYDDYKKRTGKWIPKITSRVGGHQEVLR